MLFFFFVVFPTLTLVCNTELIPFTGLNKGGRGLSTSCTKTEPNQPGVAPPSLYDDVIWNQSSHGDARGQQILALAHFKNGAGLSSLSWHSNLCLLHLLANLSKIEWISHSSWTLCFALVWPTCATTDGGEDVTASRGPCTCFHFGLARLLGFILLYRGWYLPVSLLRRSDFVFHIITIATIIMIRNILSDTNSHASLNLQQCNVCTAYCWDGLRAVSFK